VKGCHARDVQLRRLDLKRIPAENVHVPVGEFARGWFAAEGLHDDRARRGASDWYTAGVVATCRWLANATVRPDTGPWYRASGPLTHWQGIVHPEQVQDEAVAAQVLDMHRPLPDWLLDRPGWLEGTLATFDWAWWRTRSGPPIDLRDLKAG
jgi:hypothetical protein